MGRAARSPVADAASGSGGVNDLPGRSGDYFARPDDFSAVSEPLHESMCNAYDHVPASMIEELRGATYAISLRRGPRLRRTMLEALWATWK